MEILGKLGMSETGTKDVHYLNSSQLTKFLARIKVYILKIIFI